MTFTERLTAYEKLIRLDKPIGILLLLWPTLVGIVAVVAGSPGLDDRLDLRAGYRADAFGGLRHQ